MKPRNGFAAACALVAALSMAPPPARAALTVTDDTGATLTLAAPPRRIVSLAPGATEMLFAAGAGDRIVATVFGAEEPQAARRSSRRSGLPRALSALTMTITVYFRRVTPVGS